MKRLFRKVAGTDVFLAALIVTLGVLNYGWVFFPALGVYRSAANAVVVFGILAVALVIRLWKHMQSGS